MRVHQLKNSSFLKCHRLLTLQISRYATEGCTTFQDHPELTSEIRLDVDKHWRGKLPVINFDENNAGNKYYVVPMFPYPSGVLHMGHVRVYTISDTMARFHRLNGKNVLHPIGWDSFGLPAENAAIERKLPANEWTDKNIAHMRTQLEELGCSCDWSRELSTCDPTYYKWTQWLFLKIHKEGLAYQKEALVNWDPIDKTVLANEQVDAEGNSWRSGAKVERKLLKQWFIRTTKFAKQLYDGLDNPDLEDWHDIVKIQKNWMGEPNGYSFDLEVFYINSSDNKLRPRKITVWTEYPEHMKTVGFIAIKPDHILNESKETNKLLDIALKNPFNDGELIPIIVTNDVEYPPFCDIHLGVPSVSELDKSVADKFFLSCKEDKPLEKHRDAVIKKAKQKNIGGYLVSAKLQDWLISRQRYWGTPIPVIHCEKCGTLPVPEASLPVLLPENTLDDNGKAIPLKENQEWVQCKCPKCSGSAVRETDTMDTFVDSSWYFLRYLNPKSSDNAFNKKLANKMIPLDLYIGGKEHGCLHLYYARFITQFLHQLGLVPSTEPFKRLLVQGLVMGRSYQLQDGQYITENEVNILNEKQNRAQQKGTGKSVVMNWEKMSKSKRNGVDPLELFSEYSVDSIRLIMLGDASPWSPRNWSELTFPGILKWQNRVWLTVTQFNEARQNDSIPAVSADTDIEYKKHEIFLFEKRNYLINKTTYSYKSSQQLNTSIKRLQALTDALRQVPKNVMKYSSEYERALAALITMTAPMAPRFASELWSRFLLVPNRINEDEKIIKWSADVLEQKWPTIDETYQNSLQIKTNGRLVHEIKYSKAELKEITKQQALENALKLEQVMKWLDKSKIVETDFSYRVGHDAVLNIITKSKEKTKKSKQKQKNEVEQ